MSAGPSQLASPIGSLSRPGPAAAEDALARIAGWFTAQGWSPFPFQQEAWSAYLAGSDGLVHAPTGMGKTYAVWLGPLLE